MRVSRFSLSPSNPAKAALFGIALAAVFGLSACTLGSDVSRQLGARCEVHDDCDDVCLPDPEFPDGFCSVDCNGPAVCPPRSVCGDIGQGACLFRCIEQLDCEFLGPGWQCAMIETLPTGEERVCRGP